MFTNWIDERNICDYFKEKYNASNDMLIIGKIIPPANEKLLVITNKNNIYIAQREIWNGEELWYTFSAGNRKTKMMQSVEHVVYWKFV